MSAAASRAVTSSSKPKIRGFSLFLHVDPCASVAGRNFSEDPQNPRPVGHGIRNSDRLRSPGISETMWKLQELVGQVVNRL